MSGWGHGATQIEALLGKRHLERVSGAKADGSPWLKKVSQRLETATGIIADDPESAFVLAYDAARFAAEALLAQQGLRPTQAGGHIAVSEAVRAQFSGPFTALNSLRRRRNELEYPSFPGEHIDPDEVTTAITTARDQLEAAEKLLSHLAIFS